MMNQVAFQTEIGKICSKQSPLAHVACRGPPIPPPSRYHTAKTRSGSHDPSAPMLTRRRSVVCAGFLVPPRLWR